MLWGLALLVAQGGCARGVGPAAPTPGEFDPIVGLATFDTVWTTVHRTHFDTTFNGVDWSAVRTELRPRAAAARSRAELRAHIGAMLERLGQSHFHLIPREAYGVAPDPETAAADAGDGHIGLDVRLIDQHFVVTRVDSGGAAHDAGIRTGWIVDAVGTRSGAAIAAAADGGVGERGAAGRALRGWAGMTREFWGARGSVLRMRFLDHAGGPVAVKLVRRPARGEVATLPGLPPRPVWLGWERVRLDGGGSAGVIAFDLWALLLAPRFDAAVDTLRDVDGMVIDLRGNFGGTALMPSGIAGHFFTERRLLGVMKMREGELRFTANPRFADHRGGPVDPFAGPVAILVDGLSVSASELFAAGMQGAGRARIFGETTAGQVLPSTTRRLPNGDVLQYVTGDFALPTGERFEGRGVVPDVAAPHTRADLLAGRDAALEAALDWIQGQRKGAARR